MGPDEVLRAEAEALLAAADRLDGNLVSSALDLIESCQGKVVLTGAGTSGIVASKISATLTSTGTPSLFLHPSDALHGGLGMVEGDDVVIAISNGGETAEVLALLPYLQHRGCALISIVGRTDSSLARRSNVVLEACVEREACPLDLAPTSSSTLAMAIGDALAIGLLDRRGLTPEGFAYNHPSGRLGRRLTLRTSDLVARSAEECDVGPEASLLDVVQRISTAGVGAVLVVEGPRLVGIITDGDLRRAIGDRPEDIASLTAADVMTRDPTVTTASSLAIEALALMEDRPSQISVLPVVADHDGRPVGIVRLHDLVRAGL